MKCMCRERENIPEKKTLDKDSEVAIFESVTRCLSHSGGPISGRHERGSRGGTQGYRLDSRGSESL